MDKKPDAIFDLMKRLSQAFFTFSEKCEYKEGAGCAHKDFHKDFALANICSPMDCPLIAEYMIE